MFRDHHSLPLTLLVLSACAGSTAHAPGADSAPFPIRVEAHLEDGGAVPNVAIFSGSQELGHTDETGGVELALHGEEGERATLVAHCPDGFASPERPLVVGLRHLNANSRIPKFDIDCVRLVHSVLVGILAENGAHLPILQLKQRIGETDAQGVAHVVLPAANDERFTLTLDTSNDPNLRPQNPTLSFATHDHDEFVLLEHKFVVQRAAPVRVARRKGPQPL